MKETFNIRVKTIGGGWQTLLESLDYNFMYNVYKGVSNKFDFVLLNSDVKDNIHATSK